MADNELFGNSEQLDDTISRRGTIVALKSGLLDEDGVHVWRDVRNTTINVAIEVVEAMPSAQPEQRWIPCSERLPEEEKAYLVTFANEKVGMSSWHKDTLYNRGFDAYLTGLTDDGECEYFGVVAWMEKPEPWKGEKHGTSRAVLSQKPVR